MNHLAKTALAGYLSMVAVSAHAETDLIMASSLPQVHFWVGKHMDLFADAMEERTKGEVSFTRFYAGELTAVGRELDALQGGAIDVAALLLAPYHEGAFPLSDVTQLPTVGTDAVSQTRAFQALMDSDVALVDGKTFHDYEIAAKQIHAWPVATTAAYAISFAGVVPKSAADLKGMPLRAGSALHTIFLSELGATPVSMPSSASYEALSRGTVEGTILSVADWRSYSLQDVLTYTITGVAVGHWGSYLAISDAAWTRLSENERATWTETARQIAIRNAELIQAQDTEVLEESKANGGTFADLSTLAPDLKATIERASVATWKRWVEQTEAAGHPGMATAKLWATLVKEQGGALPDGVETYLASAD
ncbi:TRAP transporter substrate-binding protein DctP [Tistrella bauzanensis]